jgi:hypothetical protein
MCSDWEKRQAASREDVQQLIGDFEALATLLANAKADCDGDTGDAYCMALSRAWTEAVRGIGLAKRLSGPSQS